MSCLKATMVVLAVQLSALVAQADLLIVPDEYGTVEAACQQAFPGDSVGIRPGSYPCDEAVLRPGVTLLGLAADSTEVELVSVEHDACLHVAEGTEETIVQGITIRIDENVTSAIFNEHAHLIVQNCHLSARPDDWGEARLIVTFSDITIRRSVLQFYPESSMASLYVVGAGDVSTLTEDCVVLGYAGYYGASSGGDVAHEFRNCTFGGSLGAYQDAGLSWALDLTFVNCIFIEGLWCADSPEWLPDSLALRFNDFVAWPPEMDCGDQVGNFSADPLFCDEAAGDYRLQPDSPCRGAGEGGEDVGARLGYCYPVSGVPEQDLPQWSFVRAPFPSPSTDAVRFAIHSPTTRTVTMTVVDPSGVRVAAETHHLRAGVTTLGWDGRTAAGARAASGAYFISIRSDGGPALSRPVLLLR